MDPGVVRKAIEFNPKLLAYIKELSRQTGIPLDSLVNLAMYELIRRFGYLTPQPRSMPPPEGYDLLDQAEPAPPPIKKAPRQQQQQQQPIDKRTARALPQQMPRKGGPRKPAPARPKQEVLYYQVDNEGMVGVGKDVFLIGRGSKCDLVLPHRSISREHAVITKERNGWFIEDLNSANGTWLDNEQIGKHKINDGDEIHISNHLLRFAIRPG
jgi:hypothetical protein